MTDMDPDRPGLEVFQPHESPGAYGPNALELRDARTGALVFGVQGAGDIGRGLALDVDPRYRGYEMWGSGPTGGMYTAQLSTPNALFGPRGVEISPTKPSINFGVWWDGDLLRELLDGTAISKWDWLAGDAEPAAGSGRASPRTTAPRPTPTLSADILGDWREEVIWREARATTRCASTRRRSPPPHRFYTLMHDRQYRVGDRLAADRPTTSRRTRASSSATGWRRRRCPTSSPRCARCSARPRPIFADDRRGHRRLRGRLRHRRHDAGAGRHRSRGHHRDRHALRRRRDRHRPRGSAGQWSLDYTGTALPEGPAMFVGTSTDGEGTTGPQSGRFAVTVDVTAPAAPVDRHRVRGARARGARHRRSGRRRPSDAGRHGRRRERGRRRAGRWSSPTRARASAGGAHVHRRGRRHRRQPSAPRRRSRWTPRWRRPRSWPSRTTRARPPPTASPPTTG